MAENTDKIVEVMQIIGTLDYSDLKRLHDLIGEEYKTKAESAKARVIAEAREKFDQVGLTFEDAITS